MIGGKHDHYALGVTAQDFQRRQADTRRGIFPERLGNKVVFRQGGQFFSERADLLGDGHDQGPLASAEAVDPLGGFVDQAFAAQDL